MKYLLYPLILLEIIYFSCTKPADPTPSSSSTNTTTSNNTNPTSTATYYLVFYNGTSPVKFEYGVNGLSNAITASDVGNLHNLISMFTPFPISEKASLVYAKDYGTRYPTAGTIYDGINTGSYDFGSLTNTLPGFIINYKDENNTSWSTDNGSRVQTGSSFNITSKYYTTSFTSGFVLEGTFNCKVYDGNGNSLTLTNGKFKSLFPYYWLDFSFFSIWTQRLISISIKLENGNLLLKNMEFGVIEDYIKGYILEDKNWKAKIETGYKKPSEFKMTKEF